MKASIIPCHIFPFKCHIDSPWFSKLFLPLLTVNLNHCFLQAPLSDTLLLNFDSVKGLLLF